MDIISLSKAVRLLEDNASYLTTFVSKYTNRTDHLDKSLHQNFHIIKNNSSDEPKKGLHTTLCWGRRATILPNIYKFCKNRNDQTYTMA